MAASLRLSHCQYPLIVLVAGKQSDYVDKALASCTNCIPRYARMECAELIRLASSVLLSFSYFSIHLSL
jgi:hypothetical protein